MRRRFAARSNPLAVAGTVLILFVMHASAGEKNELGLMLGSTITPSLHITGGERLEIGSGITFQLNYARRLASLRMLDLHLEVPALAVPLQKIHAANGRLPANYDSFFVTPALRAKFAPARRVSPWLSAGGGYALFDESALQMDGSHNSTRGTSGGAFQFGGGVDFRTPIKVLIPIGARIEVRDLYTGKPNYNADTGGGFQHNLVFSGGLVLHF